MPALFPSTRRILLATALLACCVCAVASPSTSSDMLDSSKHGHHDRPTPPMPDMDVPVAFPRASSLVGWLSIACWIVVYTPQLYLTYTTQSGEGISALFLAIWLAGDLTNLLGAVWQDLLPTMIVLALYYTVCDVVLIFQVYYYRWKRERYPHMYAVLPTEPSSAALGNGSEHDPLLSAFSAHRPSSPEPSQATKNWRDTVSYVGGFIIVLVVGIVAWRLSEEAPTRRAREVWDTKAQIVGWISAFLYLGSRLPQIAKNKETKCQGLSLLMFAFSIGGNVTYVASILLTSVSPQHLLINASWLVGSGGTIFLDMIVLGQFVHYAGARRRKEVEAEMPVAVAVDGDGEVAR